MKRILFQGDSITDVGRNTDAGSTISIGQGYAPMISGKLGYEKPQEYEFVNRGISGNRIVDIYARIKADVWNLKPDVISLLIGVNDVWHELAEECNGVDAGRFERVYRMFVEDTMEVLPGVQFMLMEPFVLKGTATTEKWEQFRSEVEMRAAVVKKIAEEYNLPFVPLQKQFDEAAVKCAPSYWLADGVHPTPAGHGLIADAWLACFHNMDLK